MVNGRPLASGSRFLPSCEFGLARLELRDCLLKEAGVYKCTATNNTGSTSTSGSLRVTSEGQGVSSASLHPSGDVGLKAIVQADQAVGLRLQDPAEEDAGEQKPAFTTDLPAETSLQAGQPLFLESKLEPKLDPRLHVEWFHNGLPLANSSRIKAAMEFGFVSLTINDVTDRDQGMYTAKAVNNQGAATTFCSVSLPSPSLGVEVDTLHPRGVLGLESIGQMEARGALLDPEEPELSNLTPPRFITQFNSAELEQGAVGHFEAKLEPTNDGNITLEWMLNGAVLPESMLFNVPSISMTAFLFRLAFQEGARIWNGDI